MGLSRVGVSSCAGKANSGEKTEQNSEGLEGSYRLPGSESTCIDPANRESTT